MYKAAIIGSNGYLGRHMSYYLKKEGFNVSDFDLQPAPMYGQTHYQTLDLLNTIDLEKISRDTDYIFVFTGINGTHRGFEQYKDFLEINELALLNLLTWLKDNKCNARVIFPSSRLVYKAKDIPIKENDEKLPKTIYAVNKLAAENLLWLYYNSFGIEYTIFRISLPYEDLFENEYFKGNMGVFINRAINGKNIKVYGRGEYRRTFTHIEDVCNYMISSIQLDESVNNIYNIGGEDHSLVEVAELIAEHHKVQVEYTDWPEMDRRIESGNTVFDYQKISKLSDYTPKHRILDLIRRK